jgi:hypothetical protein
VAIGCGTAKHRLTDIYQSFIEALIEAQGTGSRDTAPLNNNVGKTELLKINKSAVESYLRCGVKEDFPDFFDTFIRPLCESALKSYLLKNYIVMDIALAAAQFVTDWAAMSIPSPVRNHGDGTGRDSTVEHSIAARDSVGAPPTRSQANNQHSRCQHTIHRSTLRMPTSPMKSLLGESQPGYFCRLSQETGQTFGNIRPKSASGAKEPGSQRCDRLRFHIDRLQRSTRFQLRISQHTNCQTSIGSSSGRLTPRHWSAKITHSQKY